MNETGLCYNDVISAIEGLTVKKKSPERHHVPLDLTLGEYQMIHLILINSIFLN